MPLQSLGNFQNLDGSTNELQIEYGKILVNNDDDIANETYILKDETNVKDTDFANLCKNTQQFLVVFGDKRDGTNNNEYTVDFLRKLKHRYKKKTLGNPDDLTIIYVPTTAGNDLTDKQKKIIDAMTVENPFSSGQQLSIYADGLAGNAAANSFLNHVSSDPTKGMYEKTFKTLNIDISRTPQPSNDPNNELSILDCFEHNKEPSIVNHYKNSKQLNIRIFYDNRQRDGVLPVIPSATFENFLSLREKYGSTFLKINLMELRDALHAIQKGPERTQEINKLKNLLTELKANQIFTFYKILSIDENEKMTPIKFKKKIIGTLDPDTDDIEIYEIMADLVKTKATKDPDLDNDYQAMLSLVKELKKKQEHKNDSHNSDEKSDASKDILDNNIEDILKLWDINDSEDNPPPSPPPNNDTGHGTGNNENKSSLKIMGTYDPHKAIPKPQKSVEENEKAAMKKLKKTIIPPSTSTNSYVSPEIKAHAQQILTTISKEEQKQKELEKQIAETNKPAKKQTNPNNTYQPPISTPSSTQITTQNNLQPLSPNIGNQTENKQKQSYTSDIIGGLIGGALTTFGALGLAKKTPLPKEANVTLTVVGLVMILFFIANAMSKKNIENKSEISLKNQQQQKQR